MTLLDLLEKFSLPGDKKCSTCKGTGKIIDSFIKEETDCPHCHLVYQWNQANAQWRQILGEVGVDRDLVYEKIINWAMDQPPEKCKGLATAITTNKDLMVRRG